MSQQEKLRKLDIALDQEYDKWGKDQRFTVRYKMLDLQREIVWHQIFLEDIEKINPTTENGQKIKEDILKEVRQHIKKLLKQAQEV